MVAHGVHSAVVKLVRVVIGKPCARRTRSTTDTAGSEFQLTYLSLSPYNRWRHWLCVYYRLRYLQRFPLVAGPILSQIARTSERPESSKAFEKFSTLYSF